MKDILQDYYDFLEKVVGIEEKYLPNYIKWIKALKRLYPDEILDRSSALERLERHIEKMLIVGR